MINTNAFSLSLSLFLRRDVQLDGYTIPAGSHVIPLINSIHMDPKLWDLPEEFNPRRFIDVEGKIKKPAFFMPFGVGRRMCLGDVLARMELFLFFATFVHSFDMRLPDGESMPSLKGNVGVTITPETFKVCLTPRPLTDDDAPSTPPTQQPPAELVVAPCDDESPAEVVDPLRNVGSS